MPTLAPWLTKLKIPDLHRLAVRLGTPCSGTKAARVSGVEQALASQQHVLDRVANPIRSRNNVSPNHVDLISIDMGIRNLAFAHLRSELQLDHKTGLTNYGPVSLRAWRKIDVASSHEATRAKQVNESAKSGTLTTTNDATKGKVSGETFEPHVYADRAFDIVRNIIDEYKPTHVIIERQRFRSGGSSAVLEWTIRVGVFEGMLYAVLRTLRGLQDHESLSPTVEGVLPARVNRFWLEGQPDLVSLPATNIDKKFSGREVKKAKIGIVGHLLQNSEPTQDAGVQADISTSLPLQLQDTVQGLVDYFQAEVRRPVNGRKSKEQISDVKVSKLDDLADCLLQGLAWLNWQNNRLRVLSYGEKVLGLPSGGDVPPKKRQKSRQKLARA